MSTVLVVEDQADILNLVRTYLEDAGYRVLVATDGPHGLKLATHQSPDLVVLDIMLPGQDGLEVCRELRKVSNVPIIMLSARGEDFDKVLGLEIGADDYLTKPFNPRELVARVRAALRRRRMDAEPQQGAAITLGSLRIEPDGRRVHVENTPVHLTPIEFSLLRVLAANPGQSLTRQRLLDLVWGPEFAGDERTVDSHVRGLRKKLREAGLKTSPISSIWGVGYRFDE